MSSLLRLLYEIIKTDRSQGTPPVSDDDAYPRPLAPSNSSKSSALSRVASVVRRNARRRRRLPQTAEATPTPTPTPFTLTQVSTRDSRDGGSALWTTRWRERLSISFASSDGHGQGGSGSGCSGEDQESIHWGRNDYHTLYGGESFVEDPFKSEVDIARMVMSRKKIFSERELDYLQVSVPAVPSAF
ncbi:hypothetical protein FISHEDRAFT_60175 [Fistulina hepatica ATCC 64428]|uniref:Uncharacterized protein n=1 Tax=Fistulina hepatica ATCC 64428 TaxID=1128425 RepID=A0A0D7A796_9AGAR|nr:hypothetical protein FISHEDRAFT_60175 [Fistulina hepatica ATCC 64428]